MSLIKKIVKRCFIYNLAALALTGCGGEAGLVAHKYQGSWTALPKFSELTPVSKHTVSTVGTHQLGTIGYGLVINGNLKIDTAGQYQFHLNSDDGSRLIIDSVVLIQNDGVHTPETASSDSIFLSKGNHELRVEYFQDVDGQILQLSLQFEGGAVTPVTAEILTHTTQHNDPNSGSSPGAGDDTGDSDNPSNTTNSIQVGQQLNSDEYIASDNGLYRFYLQGDGNLVVRDWTTRESLWSSGTHGEGGVNLILQSDGNLALYTLNNQTVWASNTAGSDASYIIMQDDGYLVMYNAAHQSVWSVGGGDSSGGEAVKVAFIGDTGSGSNFQQVLDLIKSEGAELTIVAGDTSYDDNRDDNWDSMVRSTLGSSDPALIAAGNHDYGDSDFNDVSSFGESRLRNASDVSCSGSYAEKMSCSYKNVYVVLSSIGSSGSHSNHESYISDSLDSAPDGAWRICAWHKNQKDMQAGGKSDEVGWTAYETCRKSGAIISTGHEHSYSRTHLLSDMSDQDIASSSSTFTVTEGKTFAFVSGLGGIGVRDQERSGNWWASIYTSTQGARYGAMFGTFYDDHAEFYFKNINGEIIDQFTVNKGY